MFILYRVAQNNGEYIMSFNASSSMDEHLSLWLYLNETSTPTARHCAAYTIGNSEARTSHARPQFVVSLST